MKQWFTKTGVELKLIDCTNVMPTRVLKPKKSKGLTKGELYLLDRRVDEINETLNCCDQKRDGDIIDGLISELEEIESKLNNSVRMVSK